MSLPVGGHAPARAFGMPAAARNLAPLLAALALVIVGFLRLRGLAPFAPQQTFGTVATGNLAWSDIISIYGRDTMAGHPFPYTTGHSFEYPVLTGLVFWLAGFAGYAGDATPAFVANYVVLAAAACGLVLVVSRRPGANPWLLALSPALVLYTGLNWDVLALFPGLAALLLFSGRRRDMSATGLLALSVWLKFFAILWLPLVLIERARRGEWRQASRILGLFLVLSAAINAPFAILNRHEWGLFFTFNRDRPPEVNVWTLLRGLSLSTPTVNALSELGILAAVAILGSLQWRGRTDLTIPAAAALIAWFFFLNKVYSPQYFIWLVPFLALLSTPFWLFILLSVADVLYYVASFQILHLQFVLGGSPNASLTGWDFDHVLMPAMVFREAVFPLFIAWTVVVWLAPASLGRASSWWRPPPAP